MPNLPPHSAHWKTNHEYSPDQLVRFHAVNLHHRTQTLVKETHINPSLESLLPAITGITSILNFDDNLNLQGMSLDSDLYRQAIRELQEARRNLPEIQNTNAKALIRRVLVNCIYSCIAITSLLDEP